MNVLILTPDRVGSTLLQKLITVYMNAFEYDRPVINLHELTNGIGKYWSDVYQQEVLGKHSNINSSTHWGYHQSLKEITELLDSVPHYKTSRLAHYHIINRQDSLDQQVPFYRYLNENFFIISARRENLFEHALSWCIALESKKLNVYDHHDKLKTYHNLYRNQIKVDTGFMINYIFKYQAYLKWVDDHFHVNANFYYEKDLPRIEEYILGLNLFRNKTTQSWQDMFGIKFSDWNRCHYLLSDFSGIGTQLPKPSEKLQLEHSSVLTTGIALSESKNELSLSDQQYLLDHGKNYQKACVAVNELISQGALISGIPIKLQTMLEKRLLIENFDECLAVYNQWMLDQHSQICGISAPISQQELDNHCVEEVRSWHADLNLIRDVTNETVCSDNIIMKSITS